MRNKLGDAKGGINKNQVHLIEKALTKIKNIVKNVPEDKIFKIEKNEKTIDIVERILELSNKNQFPNRLKD